MPTLTKSLDLKSLKIDDLLSYMVEQKASDLHLKPMRPPLLRLNGKLIPLEAASMTPDVIPRLIDSILSDRQRERLDENMAVDFGYSVPGVSRFRASVFLQRGTQSAVFRRVPFDFPSLDDWGLPPVLEELTRLPQGLVLLTGPTGSGKSSSLAALMQLISQRRQVHIVTIEDPIEFLLTDDKASVTQREVGTDTPSFTAALRNTLRQDPDVIMVGEMRDADTMQTVLTAAETGHLVFSTLHTNSAAQTIDRIVDSFPSGAHQQIRQQLGTVLQAVISLKLVERCDGGGLIAAVEILRQTPRCSKLIFEGNLEALVEEIENSVSYHKMQSMNQSLAALVLHRAIAHETALAASSNPSELDLTLRKFLYADSVPGEEGDAMAEPLSDFSKILELQEFKRLHEESESRHAHEIGEREAEIARLRKMAEEAQSKDSADNSEIAELRKENERLVKQIQLVRQEHEAKIERLNARVRDLSGASSSAPEAAPEPKAKGKPERRGFFRR